MLKTKDKDGRSLLAIATEESGGRNFKTVQKHLARELTEDEVRKCFRPLDDSI